MLWLCYGDGAVPKHGREIETNGCVGSSPYQACMKVVIRGLGKRLGRAQHEVSQCDNLP